MLISPSETIFPQTRRGTVYRIVGSDPDGDQLLHYISGPDASAFEVDEITGNLRFLVAPDVDAPGSAGGDNFYFIDVSVRDPSLESATQMVIIEVSRHDPQEPFLLSEGAAFLGPNTITESDPGILDSVSFQETTVRIVPDNRFGNDTEHNVHIYQALYKGGKQIEMVVNTEIEPIAEAEHQAKFYAEILGKLDSVLINGIQTIWIHPGNERFSGPVGGIVVHTGISENDYIPRGVLEEVMAHEAVHASIDPLYLGSSEWNQAQKSDINFISQYARDFVETEDLAQSYGAYLIVKNAERNSSFLVQTIRSGIPKRIQFFEDLGF